MIEEVVVFFYIKERDFERIIRKYIYEQGHGRRIANLSMGRYEIEYMDKTYQVVFKSKEDEEEEDEDE